ncbi:hypothetical protein pdam_00019012 [Pocillopora damicornis]|uniref:EGF-like domain-containing protein n=1 Tax=Pocillopora damicornis TaxID=46731 RepID=A0A3M6V1B6_POCDA|nr:hypothetical protein pdam_00019012 [Pocillopora damicornis]
MQVFIIAEFRFLGVISYSKNPSLEAVKSLCESCPCQNGGNCRAIYETKDDNCSCTNHYFGVNCEQLQQRCLEMGGLHPSWQHNQPAPSRSNENCAQMIFGSFSKLYWNNGWQDISCDRLTADPSFICERWTKINE